MENKKTNCPPKILKIFPDSQLESLNLNYEFVYARNAPFSLQYYFTCKPEKSDSEEITRMFEEVEKFVLEQQDIDGVFLKYEIEALVLSAIFSKNPRKNIKVSRNETQ